MSTLPFCNKSLKVEWKTDNYIGRLRNWQFSVSNISLSLSPYVCVWAQNAAIHFFVQLERFSQSIDWTRFWFNCAYNKTYLSSQFNSVSFGSIDELLCRNFANLIFSNELVRCPFRILHDKNHITYMVWLLTLIKYMHKNSL